MVPLGPVAVFGASNFPLAFSTAGGDTASALAAGCPVVVKGHPAHPGTGALVARAITRAVARAGLHRRHVSPSSSARGIEIGQALVRDPRIAAVGFTGSRGGGPRARRPPPPRAPCRSRSTPRCRSINPVVVLPGALAEGDVAALAQAYVGSLTLGSGQFCTNPGLLFLPSGERGDAFLRGRRRGRQRRPPVSRCSPPASPTAYASGTAACAAPTASASWRGPAGGEHAPRPGGLRGAGRAAASTTAPCADEVFGAAGVVVSYDDVDACCPASRRSRAS